MTVKPDRCGSQVYIPYLSLSPTVHSGVSLPVTMADRLKALVGPCQQLRLAAVVGNHLIYDFDSMKGKISCYNGFGHRSPSLDMFFWVEKINTLKLNFDSLKIIVV